MNLNDVEQEMKEDDERPKMEGKTVHLLPGKVNDPSTHPPFTMGPGWKKDPRGYWVADHSYVEEKEVDLRLSVMSELEPRSTIHYPREATTFDRFRGEEDEDRLVIVVDEAGVAQYMNQSKDGHLGAVEDDYPFQAPLWRGHIESPFD